MLTIKFALRRSLWLVLFLAFVGTADAQLDFCQSMTITPDPLLIPAEGGTFQHTVTTEPNPFCSCLWGSAYRVTFGRAVGFPDDLTDFPVLRGEMVENPAACVFDHTRVYEPNDGPRRTGIYGVWANKLELPIDFSTATATIKITSSVREAETLLEPNMVQDFQATVEYNLISHEEGGVVLTRIFNLVYELPPFQRPSASLLIGVQA